MTLLSSQKLTFDRGRSGVTRPRGRGTPRTSHIYITSSVNFRYRV